MADGQLPKSKTNDCEGPLSIEELEQAKRYMHIGWAVTQLVFRTAGLDENTPKKIVNLSFAVSRTPKEDLGVNDELAALGCCFVPTDAVIAEFDPKSVAKRHARFKGLLSKTGASEDLIAKLIVQQCDYCLTQCD